MSIFAKNSEQKALRFLAFNPRSSYFAEKISRMTGISTGSANTVLKILHKKGYLKRQKKGRMYFYQIDSSNPIVKQYKVLLNLEKIYTWVKQISNFAEKIILFGSTSRGEDDAESDIDLFVLSHEVEEINKIVRSSKFRNIQLVAKSPVEYDELKKRDLDFYREIEQGIVLFDKNKNI